MNADCEPPREFWIVTHPERPAIFPSGDALAYADKKRAERKAASHRERENDERWSCARYVLAAQAEMFR